ncbi:MAG: aldehyde ferredoxin oxidoreductase C-terminal domain-containing protein, partial [Planctomycetota bacterium]
TAKYRFDPKFQTGGTFGVNYSTLKGSMLSFNYRSIYLPEAERLSIHDKFVAKHYLAQFNRETIETKQQKNCGEPCVAVCKKLHGEYKKDYEPYQTMGPLCGVFDQRAAEKLTHHADMYGFDAISVGGGARLADGMPLRRLVNSKGTGGKDIAGLHTHRL